MISIERSTGAETVHLNTEEALRVIRCLTEALDALRELDGQRYVGECAHEHHRLRREPPSLEVVQ